MLPIIIIIIIIMHVMALVVIVSRCALDTLHHYCSACPRSRIVRECCWALGTPIYGSHKSCRKLRSFAVLAELGIYIMCRRIVSGQSFYLSGDSSVR